MSEFNPWAVVFGAGDPDERPVLAAFGGLGLLLATAHSYGPGPLQTSLAVVLLLVGPIVGIRLSGKAAPFFLLVAAVGAWVVFRTVGQGEPAAVPVVLLNRLAYFAVPPLVVDLVLAERDRQRLKLGMAHVYGPAVVMAVGVAVHLALRRRSDFGTGATEIRWAAAFYAGCYLVLLLVGLASRLWAREDKPVPAAPDRALLLEEEGRFGMAARVYEHGGQVEKGALAAARAGDWRRAASLYGRAGDEFNAAEMYYRAQMWSEALESYERAGALPAAARLCIRLGQVDRAVALYERAGDRASAVHTLEEAGRHPSGIQYRQAGLLEEAATAFQAAGDWLSAAEIYEHDLEDLDRAAVLHLKAGSFLHGGQLLEQLGHAQDALEAYAAVPAGAVDAARLFLSAGRSQEAAEVLTRLPPAELDKLSDETTLALVARVMIESGRHDEAVRVLQGLKRRGSVGGPVHLLLGRAFLAKGLQDLAEEELRTATSLPLDPDDATYAAYLLGCILEAAEQSDEALRVFHEILNKDLHYADVEQRYRRLKTVTEKASSSP